MWRDLFHKRGYELFDFVRPVVQARKDIEPWYRYNTLFFAHTDLLAALPAEVTRHKVQTDAPIKDYSPLPYRIRKAILQLLPPQVVSRIAILKHKYFIRSMQRR
jgi:hypothetical protein